VNGRSRTARHAKVLHRHGRHSVGLLLLTHHGLFKVVTNHELNGLFLQAVAVGILGKAGSHAHAHIHTTHVVGGHLHGHHVSCLSGRERRHGRHAAHHHGAIAMVDTGAFLHLLETRQTLALLRGLAAAVDVMEGIAKALGNVSARGRIADTVPTATQSVALDKASNTAGTTNFMKDLGDDIRLVGLVVGVLVLFQTIVDQALEALISCKVKEKRSVLVKEVGERRQHIT